MYRTGNFVLYLIVLLVTVALLCTREERKRFFAPQISPVRQMAWGVGLFLGLIVVVGVINMAAAGHFSVFQFIRLSAMQIFNFLCFQLLVAVTEEVLFRGCLTELGRRLKMPWLLIALISAALFGAGHWLFNHDLVQLVTSFVIGFVFSAAFQRGKHCSLYSLIAAHFLYDLAIVNIP